MGTVMQFLDRCGEWRPAGESLDRQFGYERKEWQDESHDDENYEANLERSFGGGEMIVDEIRSRVSTMDGKKRL